VATPSATTCASGVPLTILTGILTVLIAPLVWPF
jgi:hypothetical protein